MVCGLSLPDSMCAERGGAYEYIGRGNVVVGPRLMGSDPSRGVEANKRRVSGTTIHEVVPVYSIRLVF